MVTVGAYVRVPAGDEATVREALDRLDGVSTFALEGPGKVGVLLEAPNLDEAHTILVGPVRSTDGVLAAWPVYAHFADAVTQD